jgi:pullulanase/glycogen debranching enzyme
MTEVHTRSTKQGHHRADADWTEPLGWLPDRGLFRLAAPKAKAAWLIERRHPEDAASERVTRMVHRRAGHHLFWEVHQPEPQRYYRFLVEQDGEAVQVADPWSRAVARQWAPYHPTWSVAQVTRFDWSGDVRPAVPITELIAVELHVRDFTLHPSAGVRHPGTYAGLAELVADRVTGLAALRDLGANAVELLPVTSFAALEPLQPHNPTGRNHWGYMPSFWMAASERYSLAGADPQTGQWIGVHDDGRFDDPGDELRAAIAALHRHGIAVIVDLVFNHVSTVDGNPLELLDPGTWRVRNSDGSLRNHSGCGHDIDGHDPLMRHLMVTAARHWFDSYHVDGIRLDLADILDDRALIGIRDTCTEAWSRCLLLAEPWSMAGYQPARLVSLGYTVWNDQFRNAVVGHAHGSGWVMGQVGGGVAHERLASMLVGVSPHTGHQHGAGHAGADAAIHYIESHDDHTHGDLLRIALGDAPPGHALSRQALQAPSPPLQQRLHLAASALLLARGPLMLAQGQEWGRAKVRPHDGALDGNSYCRDDATNHLDWTERTANRALVEHYRRLIAIRRDWLAAAFALPTPPVILHSDRPAAFGYALSTRRGQVAVLLSGDQQADAWFHPQGGPWWLLYATADVQIVPTATGVAVRLQPCTSAVLWSG